MILLYTWLLTQCSLVMAHALRPMSRIFRDGRLQRPGQRQAMAHEDLLARGPGRFFELAAIAGPDFWPGLRGKATCLPPRSWPGLGLTYELAVASQSTGR